MSRSIVARFVCFLVLGCAGLALGVRAEINLKAVLPEVILKDGTVLKNVKIVGYSEHAISAKWDSGKGTILHEDLPDDVLQAILNKGTKSPSRESMLTGDFTGRYPQRLNGTVLRKEGEMLIVSCFRPQPTPQQRTRPVRTPPSPAPTVGTYYEAPSAGPAAPPEPYQYFEGTAAIRNHPDVHNLGVNDPINVLCIRVGDYPARSYSSQMIPMFRLQ